MQPKSYGERIEELRRKIYLKSKIHTEESSFDDWFFLKKAKSPFPSPNRSCNSRIRSAKIVGNASPSPYYLQLRFRILAFWFAIRTVFGSLVIFDWVRTVPNAQILAEILGFNMTGTKVVRRALRKKLRLDRDRRRDWGKLKPRLNDSGGLREDEERISLNID
ncbi:hypothetical protein LXL04_031267 [Taraxacum kok-saghyz]